VCARIITAVVHPGTGRWLQRGVGTVIGGCAPSGSSMNDTGGSLEEVTMVPAVSGGCGGAA
jgi:hypothetical protein